MIEWLRSASPATITLCIVLDCWYQQMQAESPWGPSIYQNLRQEGYRYCKSQYNSTDIMNNHEYILKLVILEVACQSLLVQGAILREGGREIALRWSLQRPKMPDDLQLGRPVAKTLSLMIPLIRISWCNEKTVCQASAPQNAQAGPTSSGYKALEPPPRDAIIRRYIRTPSGIYHGVCKQAHRPCQPS